MLFILSFIRALVENSVNTVNVKINRTRLKGYARFGRDMDSFISSVKLIDLDKQIIEYGQQMRAKIVIGHKIHSGNKKEVSLDTTSIGMFPPDRERT